MLAAIARFLLRLGGWTPVGGVPDIPKAVFVAAPHTSNWDGVWALIYKVAIGLDIKFFAKQSLFWFPLGILLRGLGAVPLDRKRAGSAVDQAVAQFENNDSFFFGLAPEGTRSRRPHWKSGFYRIAEAANVPIVLGFLDYGERELGLGPIVDVNIGQQAVLAECRKFYANVKGRWPEKFGPVRFPDEDVEQQPQRSVRSFVRRSGRLTTSQEKALSELWPYYGIEFEDTLLDLDTVFGRRAPRVLEIGFGNGDTLVQQASESPDRDFIGIEVHEPGVGHCLLKARDAGVDNLKLIMHDAIEVLGGQIPEGSLERVNLYFPDPWPKKRHHKRRIVSPAFLGLVAGRLQPRGALHIATDWADYAEHIDEALEASEWFRCAERREHDGNRPLARPRTKFERRGLKKGHRIVDWRFERIA